MKMTRSENIKSKTQMMKCIGCLCLLNLFSHYFQNIYRAYKYEWPNKSDMFWELDMTAFYTGITILAIARCLQLLNERLDELSGQKTSPASEQSLGTDAQSREALN